MYKSSNYTNSFTVEKLKTFYGEYFHELFKPWNLTGRGIVTSTASRQTTQFEPIFITSNTHTYPPHYITTNAAGENWYPSQLDLISTSATDGPGSTGALKILLHGVDYEYGMQTESVRLNGQTAVKTKRVWRYINNAYVISSGNKQSDDTIDRLNGGSIEIGKGGEDGSTNTLIFPWYTITPYSGSLSQAAYQTHRTEVIFITKINIAVATSVGGTWSMWKTFRYENRNEDRKGTSDVPTAHVNPQKRHRQKAIKVLTGIIKDGMCNLEFDEPYTVQAGELIYFTIDNLDGAGIVGVHAQGFKTDGTLVWESQRNGNFKITKYKPKDRTVEGLIKKKAKDSIQTMKANTKRALRRPNSFYTLNKKNKGG